MTKAITNDNATMDPASLTGISPLAARLSFVAAAGALVFLAALHVLSPEFDPSWRMVSEYALGDFKWVVTLMFLSWALSCFTLFFAIKSQINTLGGRIGLFLLLTAGVGMTMASMFDWTHSLHGLATMLGIPTFPIAALIISVSLSRKPAWSSARKLLLWTANLTWITLVWMQVMLFSGLAQTGGEFGPEVLIGWPNRAVIAAYGAWLMAVAAQAMKLYHRQG